MNHFVKRLTCFLFLFSILYFTVAEYIFYSHNYLSKQFSFSHVLDRIARSKQIEKSDTLYFGDSVAEQLFSYYKNNNSLTINGAVLMSGQYILIKNSLTRNNIKHLYLVINPSTLGISFNNRRVFSNFIKPFFSFDNLADIEPVVYTSMNSKPYSYLYIFAGFKFLPFSDIEFENTENNSSLVISKINEIYLSKIIALTKQKKVELHLVATPTANIYQTKFQSIESHLSLENKELKKLLFDYEKSIRYIPLSEFRDSLHLTPNSISDNLAEYKSWILSH